MKPDCIITADMHLRDDVPVCRTDNYWEAQDNKVTFLNKTQREYNIPILDAGDLFNRWKSSPYLLAWTINKMSGERITVPGNHDLPEHSLLSFERSGLAVLEASHTIQVDMSDVTIYEGNAFITYTVPWNRPAPTKPNSYRKRNVLILHKLAYLKKEPYPGAKEDGVEASSLLDQYGAFDLIITGHNHQSFTIEKDKTLLVNPGSMMRMNVSQIDHEPGFFLWYAKANRVEKINYPIEKNVISKKHIEVKKERDERIDAFVKRLRDDIEIGLSFEDNIERFLSKNKTKPRVEEIIKEVIANE